MAKPRKKMDYQIQIGEVIDTETNLPQPKQRFNITQDQYFIIEMFADVKKDEELNRIYTINNCDFKIVPLLNINTVTGGS